MPRCRKMSRAAWRLYAGMPSSTPPRKRTSTTSRSLASQICGTPIALISLVDEQRQWFKSRQGFEASETPRDTAFCAHGILEPDMLIVEDARLDSRFSSNPMVKSSPGICFYAGAPLKTSEGHALGMLCVKDYTPRKLTDGQAQALRVLGRQVVNQMELRRRATELARMLEERERAEAALKQAQDTLQSIFENTAEGVFQTTPDGRTLTTNPAFARMIGYDSPQEMIANVHDNAQDHYVLPERRAEFRRQLETCGTLRDFEVELRRRDGTRFWISISARTVHKPGGELHCYEGIVIDITERKRAQEALRQAHEQLEQRVEERTRELNQTNRELSAEIASRKRAQQELEVMHQQLVEASRQAGMAEIATGILHNVGNIITSINVSSGLVSDKVRKSRVASVTQKAAALMEEHADDLPGFFANDPRGKKLMVFLSSLAKQLALEQKTLLDEMASLLANVEHIKEIVTLQQGYAKSGGAREAVPAAELIQQALRLNAATLENHQIQVTREYSQTPPVQVEKHKVLQILVNLIRNAQHALDEAEPVNRRLTLRVADNGNNTAGISVVDNGGGIRAENLGRLFEYGFTTRKEGHGFGLHSGARTARELGGTLTAHSDGPGKGASFTLTLPCQGAASTTV